MKLKTGLELLVLIITLCSALSLKTSKSLQSSLTLKEDTLANKNKDTNTKVKRMEEYLKVLLEKPYKMNTEDQVSFSNNLEVTQKHLVCVLECNNIALSDFDKNFFKKAKVNFSESSTTREPCPE